jgi:hypothetical protein
MEHVMSYIDLTELEGYEKEKTIKKLKKALNDYRKTKQRSQVSKANKQDARD